MTKATKRYVEERAAPDGWVERAEESRKRILEKYNKGGKHNS